MNSKTNKKNRVNSPALSTSTSQSPYNLRRNQSQPGAVAKRNNTTKPRKDISATISQPPNQHASSSTSQKAQNPPELSSNDEEQIEESGDTNNMEHSDDEEESEAGVDASDIEGSDGEQQLEESGDTSSMERSDEEEEALAFVRHTEREKKKPPSIWSHFDLLYDNIYLCKICSKCIKTYHNNDSNLRSHLGRAHHMLEVMYKSQRQQRVPKPNAIKPETKRKLDDAAVECVITDGRAFGDFRRLGMSKFLNVICPGYSGPSRKTVRKRLSYSYHAYRAELRATLASINSIAITVDVCTKKQMSFICLTGHAFNKKYQSISLVLGFRRLSGSHGANKLKKYISYELKQLQIEDKVCAIVSDNGTDIIKAINDIKPGQRFSCFAHDVNRVVKNGLQIWMKSKRQKQQAAPPTANSFENAESSDDARSESDTIDVPEELEYDEHNYDYSSSDEIESHSSGGSESRSGVGGSDADTETYSDYDGGSEGEENDEEDEVEENVEENLSEIQRVRFITRQLIKRIRAFINKIRGTRVINSYVKKQAQLTEPIIKSTLITDLEIRWNTTYVMIDRFLMHRFIIHNINSQPSKIPHISQAQQMKLGSKKFEFSNSDWHQMVDLHTVLKRFFIATNIISAKHYPTLAIANSIEFALRHFLSTTSEKESTWLKWLKLCLYETFELYFDKKMEQHQKNISLVSAFLDPSEYCRLRERPNDLQKAVMFLKVEMQKETLRTFQETNTANSVNATTSTSSTINLSSNSVKSNIENLFSLCGVGSTSAFVSSSATAWSIDEEIGFYVSFVNGDEKVKFARFWTDHGHRLPIMSAVVRRVNIIPASSVPCEATFSVAGYIRRKQRSSLSSTALRYSIVLKDSHKLELLKN